jgi:hypothetical protein
MNQRGSAVGGSCMTMSEYCHPSVNDCVIRPVRAVSRSERNPRNAVCTAGGIRCGDACAAD